MSRVVLPPCESKTLVLPGEDKTYPATLVKNTVCRNGRPPSPIIGHSYLLRCESDLIEL